MAKKPTIVEINGRKYDANTGQLIAGNSSAQKSNQREGSIDGFSSPITGTSSSRRQAGNARDLHKITRKSQKLHSAAAKRQTPKPAIRAVATKQVTRPSQISQPAARQTAPASVQRINRAQTLAKNQNVARFNQTVAPQAPIQKVAPQPAKTTPVVMPKEIQGVNEEPVQSRRGLRLAPVLAVVTLLLAGGAYLTYLNLPNFALKIASSRAGLDASLPGYKPEGFDFDGPIAYSPGQLTLRFDNNDEKEFKISQKESSWDSQSLLDNFVIRENKNYITFQERGLTIYIYDDNQATWVDRGVWYTIEGNAQLSTEQIRKIAGSL